MFFEETSNSTSLSECFLNEDSLENQVQAWESKFTSAIKNSFKRIRITNVKEVSKSQQLVEKRKNLRIKLKTATDNLTVDNLQGEINHIESQLSSLLAEENVHKIKDNLSALSNTDGSSAVSGLWKLKNKLFPKNTKTLPMSWKIDFQP